MAEVNPGGREAAMGKQGERRWLRTGEVRAAGCWYCGAKPARGRIYCKRCLARIASTGCVDSSEWPTKRDARLAKVH